MPRIPVYQDQARPVDLPGVRLGARATPDAFSPVVGAGGQALAGALDDTAKTVLTVGEKIQKKKDNIWVQERLAKLAQQYDAYTYGTPDGQVQGVLTAKGLAAADAAKTSGEFLDKTLNDMLPDAPSSDAAEEFRIRAMSIRTGTSSTIARHAATEINRYHAEAAIGNAQVQAESVAADYNRSPEEIDQAFTERIAPSVLEAARLTGKPADEALRERRAVLYADIIKKSLADGNVTRAKDLMGTWDKSLSADDRTRISGAIRKETVAQESLSAATRLLDSGASDTAAKKWIDETYAADIDMRDATLTRFRQEKAFRKQDAEESKRAQYGNLLKGIFTESDPRKRVEMAMRANPEFFQGALSFAESLNKPPATDPVTKENNARHDAVVNAGLRRMVDAGMFESEQDILVKAAEMNIQEMGNAQDSVNYWRSGGGGLKDTEVRTMFKEMTGKDAASKPELYASVYQYIAGNAPKAEGRQIPPETVRKLMGQALISGDVKGRFSDMTLSEFSKTGKPMQDFRADIDDDVREAITAELKRQKKRVSEENIQTVYRHEYLGIPVPKKAPITTQGH